MSFGVLYIHFVIVYFFIWTSICTSPLPQNVTYTLIKEVPRHVREHVLAHVFPQLLQFFVQVSVHPLAHVLVQESPHVLLHPLAHPMAHPFMQLMTVGCLERTLEMSASSPLSLASSFDRSSYMEVVILSPFAFAAAESAPFLSAIARHLLIRRIGNVFASLRAII